MFTKEEIKSRFSLLQTSAQLAGAELHAELNLATLIASCALFSKKVRSGNDYLSHPLFVATSNTRSESKRIIGMLHDVIEDSDWTLDDLRELGFSPRIIKGVDGVTKRKGELYFDFIVRCGLSGGDAIDVKINDLHHNSDNTRYRHIGDSEKNLSKQDAYNIAYNYLIDLKKFKEDSTVHINYPGTSMIEYIKKRPEYFRQPARVNRLLDEFSSSPERLPVPPLPTVDFNLL